MGEPKQQKPPILRSKLYRPRLGTDIVDRAPLRARLDEGRTLPLTLVSAPAGYGKSTLVSQWLATTGLPAAWLSLDYSDSDIQVFLRYLVAALQTVFPDSCGDTATVAQSDEPPRVDIAAAALSNDIDAIGEPCIIVLDDYHRIGEEAIHRLLDQLLDHPPPNIDLIIVSRVDPPLSIASLRGRNRMVELRMRDLRFTRQEAAAFLRNTLDQPIDEDEINRLHEGIEGWPVALRLAAVALRDHNRVEELMGGIRGDSWKVHEYLVEEVLAQHSVGIRNWMTASAILDRFCGPLVEAVCAHLSNGDIDGRGFIDLLERRGLFCIALDDQHEWYRFHHLFQEVLHRRLKEQIGSVELTALHARAAEWFESEGYFEDAIRHYLEGNDPAAAADLIARHRDDIMNGEQWDPLERWLSWLPPEMVENNLQLLVLKAWLLQNRGRYPQCFDVVKQAQALIDRLPDDAVQADVIAHIDLMGYVYSLVNGDAAGALECSERALKALPAECHYARGSAMICYAASLLMNGQLEKAYQSVYEALGSDPPLPNRERGRLLTSLVMLHWNAADRQGIELAATRAVRLGREHNLAETTQLGRYFLGVALYNGNKIDEAEPQLVRAADARNVPNSGYFAHANFALSALYEAKGEPTLARQTAQAVTDYMLRTGNAPQLALCKAWSADLALRHGRLSEALEWVTQQQPGRLTSPWRFFLPELVRAKVLVAEGSEESRGQAGELLDQIEAFAAKMNWQRFLIETFALQAQLRSLEGDQPTALEQLGQAVALAQPGRWIRPFVDLDIGLVALLHKLDLDGDALEFVGEILGAFQGAVRSEAKPPRAEVVSADLRPAEPLAEPLTPRENEILCLLSERLTNREIAERLFISPGTVKTHTHSIYEKLGVSGRQKVVAKARGLGIIRNA